MISTFSTIFLGIFIEALPFLLMGTLASGIVEVFVNREALMRWLPTGRFWVVLTGGLLGFLFPVCECGVVPLTRRLYQKGMPLSMGIAFLLAAPIVNPIVIISTHAAFGWGPVFWGRIGLGLGTAVLTGLLFSFQPREEALRPRASSVVCPLPAHGDAPSGPFGQKLIRVGVIAADELFEMGFFLILGAFLAALMQTVVPQNALLSLGQGPLVSVVLLAALGVLLSICSTVDAFVALSFAASFSTGSILAFLVYGPMVDIKSVFLFARVFKGKSIVYLVLVPLFLVVLAAVFINFRLGI